MTSGMRQWVAEYQHPNGWRPFQIQQEGQEDIQSYVLTPDSTWKPPPVTLDKALTFARLFKEIDRIHYQGCRVNRVRNVFTGHTIIL